MRPNQTRDPCLRWLMGVLMVFDVHEIVGYGGGGLVMLGIAFAIWRTPIPVEKGPASQLVATNAHETGLMVFGGLGAIFLLISLGYLWSFLRDLRDLNDGKWG